MTSIKNKLTINSRKPDREYHKVVLTYETATPATGRIAREMEKNANANDRVEIKKQIIEKKIIIYY